METKNLSTILIDLNLNDLKTCDKMFETSSLIINNQISKKNNMEVIREKIDVELIFETYKVKMNDPNIKYGYFCIHILGTSVTLVNGWKNSTHQMSKHKKSKVLELTGLTPDQYTKIITLNI